MFVFLYGNNGKACVALTGTSMFPSLVSTVSCEQRLFVLILRMHRQQQIKVKDAMMSGTCGTVNACLVCE